MKKTIFLFFSIFLILFSFAGCNTAEENVPITAKEAKDIITAHSPEAIILECDYDTLSDCYVIVFKTSFGSYEGVVHASSGSIVSVSVKENFLPDTEFPEEEVSPESKYIPIDTALATVLVDSGIDGTGVVLQSELDEENERYIFVIRSGDEEYSYAVDAVTGKILIMQVNLVS